jgi:hypothetical protein
MTNSQADLRAVRFAPNTCRADQARVRDGPRTPSLSSSSTSSTSSSTTSPAVEGAKPLTPSDTLRMRHQHLQSLHVLANRFGARIVDVSENSIILRMSSKTFRVEAFFSLVKPFGIIHDVFLFTSIADPGYPPWRQVMTTTGGCDLLF